MNGVERFFRRYVFSTLGLLALLFAANVAVLAGLLLVGEMTVPTAFSITAFCDNLTGSGGDWKVNVVGQQPARWPGNTGCPRSWTTPIPQGISPASAGRIWRTGR